MKRSKMLEIIKKQWNNSTSFPTDDAVAKYILDEIEKAGMLPPERDKIIEKHLCTVNEWEPEDAQTYNFNRTPRIRQIYFG